MSEVQSRSSLAFAAFAIVVLVLTLAISGCQAKQNLIVQDKEFPEIHLIADSPGLRQMISQEEAVEAMELNSWQKPVNPKTLLQQLKDVAENPEKYTPGRSAFLLAMRHQPSVAVHDQAHIEIVSTSLASCTLIAFASAKFVNVRVLDGSDRGEKGWVCSDKINIDDAKSKAALEEAKKQPPVKTTLCEMTGQPDKYVGRVVEVRAAVEQGFEVSLLTDKTCSARIWFDTTTANLDEEHYQRIEESLRRNNGFATVVGRFDHVGWLSRIKSNGFGHLGQWQSQLIMFSFKGSESEPEPVVPKTMK